MKLFASVLRREADGSYWLVTPAERGTVEVEDRPFLGLELRAEGHGPQQNLAVRTSVDDWVEIDAAHPLRLAPRPAGGVPTPVVEVRRGLEARLSRAVYYELVNLALADESTEADEPGEIGVWSHGTYFPLGSIAE